MSPVESLQKPRMDAAASRRTARWAARDRSWVNSGVEAEEAEPQSHQLGSGAGAEGLTGRKPVWGRTFGRLDWVDWTRRSRPALATPRRRCRSSAFVQFIVCTSITENTDVVWTFGREQGRSVRFYGHNPISPESSTASVSKVLSGSGTRRLCALHIHHPSVPSMNS